MSNLIWLSCAGVLLTGVLVKLLRWIKNRAVAQSAGFPVCFSPVHIADMWWMAVYPMVAPIVDRLPRSWTQPWLPMSQVWNIWKAGYGPFEEVDSDTFMLATPNGNVLWSCDPAVIKALFTQPDKSQMPTEMMAFFDLWGPTLSTTEGAAWRESRRIISSGFNPSTNQSVWEETRRQCGMILQRWADDGGVVKVMKDWTAPLALHVISAVFFDKKIDWSRESEKPENLPPNHKLRYETALFTVLDKLAILAVTPKWVLNHVPLKPFQKAGLAFEEFTRYILELCDHATQSIHDAEGKKRKNMLETIVAASIPEANQRGLAQSQENIMGNMFFTLMAGHETVGSSLSFILMLLAIHPEHQQRMQEELDEVLGDCPIEDADMQLHFNRLLDGFTGAVIKETLRAYNPAQFSLRRTVAPLPVVDSKGQHHVIPANTTCVSSFAAAFRNPNTWPRNPNVGPARRAQMHDSPALDWDPTRWLKEPGRPDLERETSDGDALIYVPFGQGGRVCLGKSFAQIEMVAAIMTLLKNHKLELVVEESLVSEYGGNRQRAWEVTRDKRLIMLVDNIEPNIAIQVLKEVPIKCTPRT
ncbi:Cytochrome P450 2J3 [Trichoderma cornu-damae]|uniref:Cytochrome P450 2J3 n=1 Tax=Trichoderma cornu-damae TaxID=654480 RepID=A0A9P8QF70_9HYPO|nr:Cytochrome P450 2J3 [Trichoderma cornu-damae]